MKDVFYHWELDILRFFAFLMVFSGHMMPNGPGAYVNVHGTAPKALAMILKSVSGAGGYGVDLFFALSAYLITELLLREVRLTGKMDLKSFYIRRALRIWPLYFFFLLLLQPMLHYIIPSERLDWHFRVAFLFFGGNWACARWGFPLTSVASPLWSISIEEQFYIMWPIGLKFCIKHIPKLALSLLVISAITRLILVAHHAPYFTIWCNTFSRLDPIAMGILLAYKLQGKTPELSMGFRLVLAATGTTVILFCGAFGPAEGILSLWALPAVAIASVLLILSILSPPSVIIPRSTFSRALIYLGRISYGLYVFHVLAIRITKEVWARCCLNVPHSWLASVVFAFIVTCAAAVLSYKVLESPFLRIKTRFAHVQSRPGG